ncbi:hypothetical protein ANCCEY_02546 [Ancylostoma ceylanicum]|uniref:Transmembrane protein 135 N-terminal domain-containing protein n=1 Tax=Ancylostoma ceylanicum TaxID=53326 RepID=A0A0D6MC70_9BILA|nr:hypothetical protein ANCCEY_02546 [Ancylostoma ceylanicum]
MLSNCRRNSLIRLLIDCSNINDLYAFYQRLKVSLTIPSWGEPASIFFPVQTLFLLDMTTLSKLAVNIGLPVLNTNCYETIHTWTPDCNQAIIASETLFRQLSNHGYIPKVKNGEVVPFIIGMGLLSYLYTASKLDNSTERIFALTHNITGERDIAEDYPLPKQFKGFLYELRKKYGRTELCEHKHSCISNAAESFSFNFVIGIGVSSALVLLRNLPILFKNPVKLLDQLFSKSTLRIPTFFGLMPLIFHAIRCSLNRLPWSCTMSRNVTAGAASGLAMLAFPNVSIAMYVMWKAIEIIYFDLVKQGKIRSLPYGDLLLYTVSTGYVLWQIIIEPQAIRKGYLKFLLGLTGNRMSLLNRDLYEHFGYQSRLLFPYRPVLNTKYVTINPMLYQPVSPP